MQKILKRFVALQHNFVYNTHIRNQLKENTMFDYKDAEKKFQDLVKQVQQINEFWVNAYISSLKQFTK